MIFIRVFTSFKIAFYAYKSLFENNFLTWALLPFMLLNFPQGSWNQPTGMGFSIISLGLLIASLKSNKN
jgi:hypothetical protein